MRPAALPERDRLFRLMARHTRPIPRYTSYPTVPYWDRAFGEGDYLEALDEAGNAEERPLSVYVHLPFCAKRCYYCGCNAVAAHREEAVDRYLDRLEDEVERVVERLGRGRTVTWMHWGGGTPNFLTDLQTVRLFRLLTDAFQLAPGAEVSIEMDPRVATPRQPRLLKGLGFTRISMGVQDFDPKVQAAIGRHQPEAETVALLDGARAAGFESVNFDLVYGLPYQTPERFARTLARVVELAPDRIAAFSYAHLPEVRPIQRAVDASGLPDPEAKLALFLDTVETLQDAGYAWIGFDHFARAGDELAVAARERRLHRNFMGYTTRAAVDQVAFGMSAIGYLADRFVQNEPELGPYERALSQRQLPVVRGHRMSRDDRFRALVIQHLLCNLEIRDDLTLETFGEPVGAVLGEELERLLPFREEGFLSGNGNGEGWQVTDTGRFFVRNLAAELDPYLRGRRELPVFSSSV